MTVTVNGTQEELEQTITISDYLIYKELDTKLVVIEWNFTTLPREQWSRIILRDGDNLEIIKIIGGG
jgi:sulfur carrier protein